MTSTPPKSLYFEHMKCVRFHDRFGLSVRLRTASVVLLVVLAIPRAKVHAEPFTYGADLSFVPWLRANGAVWTAYGVQASPLYLFHQTGWNGVRLRLWHTPITGGWEEYHGLDSTLVFAHEIVDEGMPWMLDFHYSDTWADPGKQYTPAAWEDLDLATLDDSLYNYTRDVIARCREEGILPTWVQIGNEINNGLLWPVGQLYGTDDDAQAWRNYAHLLLAAKRGVLDGAYPDDPPKIVLQYGDGGSVGGATWWADHTLGYGVTPDIFGFSFYPWWHGSLGDLRETLNTVADKYHLPVMVVETSYPFTLDWNDNQTNIVGSGTPLPIEYPATPAGQELFLSDLRDVVREVPGGLGIGVWLWEPAWITAPTASSGGENLAVYDFNGAALPALNLPNTESVDEWRTGGHPSSFMLGIPYPTPTNGSATVTVDQLASGSATLEVVDLLGRQVRSISLSSGAGQHRLTIDLSGEASGIYFLRLSTPGTTPQTRRIVLVR